MYIYVHMHVHVSPMYRFGLLICTHITMESEGIIANQVRALLPMCRLENFGNLWRTFSQDQPMRYIQYCSYTTVYI